MRFRHLLPPPRETVYRAVPTPLTYRTCGLACGVLAATLAATQPCPAQMTVEVTPTLGAYLPGAALVIDTVAESGIDTRYVSGATVRERSAVIGGAHLTAWLGKQVALEMVGGYSPSGTVTRTYACYEVLGGPPSDCISVSHGSAHVVTGSARLLVSMTPPTEHLPSLYLIGGWNVVNHGGAGFDAAERTAGHALQRTYWGPILGAGVRMPLTPTRAPRVELVRVQSGTQPQAAWVVSLGLSATLTSAR